MVGVHHAGRKTGWCRPRAGLSPCASGAGSSYAVRFTALHRHGMTPTKTLLGAGLALVLLLAPNALARPFDASTRARLVRALDSSFAQTNASGAIVGVWQ